MSDNLYHIITPIKPPKPNKESAWHPIAGWVSKDDDEFYRRFEEEIKSTGFDRVLSKNVNTQAFKSK